MVHGEVPIDCPACQSRNARDQGWKNDFRVLSCDGCGTLYTESLPELNNAQDYDIYYTCANLIVPEFINDRLDQIVASFEPYRKTNRLLDLGCGAGSLLQAARRAKWRADGLDVSKTAVDHVRAQGFEAFCGDLSEANYPSAYYDVITASELLEHVPDAARLVNEAARILRPGGLCWITTPHSRGLSGRLLNLRWSVISPPEHLHLFSASGLRRLLISAGFQTVRIDTEGVNPFELLKSLRPGKPQGAATNGGGFDRVRSSYQLNEALTSNAPRRALKNIVNGVLRITQLGDSLKVRAER